MTQTELAAALVNHFDALYNLATWLACDVAGAQALVQMTCRQALQMVPQQLPGTTARVGLLTLMWGIYCQRHGVLAAGGDSQALEPPKPVKRTLLHTLSRTDLDAGLRQLPETLRAALVLADLEGCRGEEVAEVFGWSQPQTFAVLARARQLLESILQVRLAATAGLPTSGEKDSL
jgi:DNA-directed RNA polymerase specialized sigma24 family protein